MNMITRLFVFTCIAVLDIASYVYSYQPDSYSRPIRVLNKIHACMALSFEGVLNKIHS